MRSSLSRSFAYCERLARREAANFYPAFRILPAPQRRGMCALYAFFRITDDLGDGPAPVPDKRQGLDRWARALDDALTGSYSHPAHAALHAVVRQYAIPRTYLEAVLDGVAMDLQPVAFARFDDLVPYCHRVASAVGLCCIRIWGCTDDRANKYAEAAGIAFQLTNILRDLREDAGRDRVYLPLEDLKRFAYTPDDLRLGVQNDRFRELMHFEIERARSFYAQAWPLANFLPPAGRAIFQVLMQTYHGLLDAMERSNYDVFSTRVRVSRWYKLLLLLRAFPIRWGWL
jgi:phytoene synthase